MIECTTFEIIISVYVSKRDDFASKLIEGSFNLSCRCPYSSTGFLALAKR
jgi:hypothetical protein